MSDVVVDIQDVYREFRLGGEIVRALQGIALRINRMERREDLKIEVATIR